MSKMPKDIKDFHNAMIEIANYLIVLEPELLNWYSPEDYEYDEFPHDKQKYKYHRLVLDKLGRADADRIDDIEHCYNLRLIKQVGGEENMEGLPYYYIFKFKGKFYKLPAHYSSYDGSPLYWVDLHQVQPEDRTVTIYKRVSGDGFDYSAQEEQQLTMELENDENSF